MTIYLKSSKRINKIAQIKPNPMVSIVKEITTKKTNGKSLERVAPDNKLTSTKANSPRLKFTAFEITFEAQNILGSTRIFKNIFEPLAMDSAECNRPWEKNVIARTPHSKYGAYWVPLASVDLKNETNTNHITRLDKIGFNSVQSNPMNDLR